MTEGQAQDQEARLEAAFDALDDVATRLLATTFPYRDNHSVMDWRADYREYLTKIVSDAEFTGGAPDAWRSQEETLHGVDDELIALDLSRYIPRGEGVDSIDRWRRAYWRKYVWAAMHLAAAIVCARRETTSENVERLTRAVVHWHNEVLSCTRDYVEAATHNEHRTGSRA